MRDPFDFKLYLGSNPSMLRFPLALKWAPIGLFIVGRVLPTPLFVVVVLLWSILLTLLSLVDQTPMLPIEENESLQELIPAFPDDARRRSASKSVCIKQESEVAESAKSPIDLLAPPMQFDVNGSTYPSLKSPSRSGRESPRTNDWTVRYSRDLTIAVDYLFPKFRFQVASDLHIETIYSHRNSSREEIEVKLRSLIIPSAPFLILAGDIGCPGSFLGEEYFKLFLEMQSEAFRDVFLVAGNHEYYSEISGITGTYLTAPEIHSVIKDVVSCFNNVHFLDRKAVLIDGLRLIGCTLWTDVAPDHEQQIQSCISDYRRIHVPMYAGSKFPGSRPVTVHDTRIWHKYDLKFLQKQLALSSEHGQGAVIVTHHAPIKEGTSHPGHCGSALSSAFSNDFMKLISKSNANLKAWVFGHTHYCCDFYIDGVRIFANQRGYSHDLEDRYSRSCVIEV